MIIPTDLDFSQFITGNTFFFVWPQYIICSLTSLLPLLTLATLFLLNLFTGFSKGVSKIGLGADITAGEGFLTTSVGASLGVSMLNRGTGEQGTGVVRFSNP